MDLRQFFILQSWWGKLLGAFFGYLIDGAAGALFGLLIGNFFDKGLSQYFSSSFWYWRAEKDPTVRRIFFMHLFTLLGHIAKTDGRVTPQSILFAKQCMQEMRLNPSQRRMAQNYFNVGKQSHYPLSLALNEIYRAIYQRPKLIKLFIDTQYQMTQIETSINKLHILNSLLREFNLAPLPTQAYTYYHSYNSQQNKAHSYSNQHHQTTSRTSPYHPLAHAYSILEISPSASQQEVKRAYRRLISRNHPDKLIAKGLSEKKIQEANEKTQKIRKAYEEIWANKGW